MRKDWEVKKLGDVCISDLGKTLNKSKDTGLLLPYLCSINVQWNKIDLSTQKEALFEENDIKKYSVKKGDLLVCEGGDIGRAAIWSEDYSMLYQNALHRIRLDKNIIAEYVLYFLWQLKRKGVLDKRYAKGVTIKHLVKSSLLSINIPVPPLQIQQQIVEEFDRLTSIIEKQKKQLEELDNLAQAIFYDMFGDPIVNEKGWSIKKIKDISLSVNYGTSSPSTEDGKYKYLRMNNITAKGTIDLSSIKYINVPPEDLEKYVVRKGDILFNRTNSKELVGKTALYTFEEDMIIAGYIIRLKVIDSIALPIFLSSYLNTSCIKEYFRSIAKGAVNQSNINSKQLLSTSVFIPPLPLQQQFASKIEAIEKQKELIKKSIKETEDLFNSRMDYYFN